MRAWFYDIVGIALLLSCCVFFYLAVSYIAQKDYVAAVLGLAGAFTVVKAGVELCKLAVYVRRTTSTSKV